MWDGNLKFHNLLEEPLEFKSFLNEVVSKDPLLKKIWVFISTPPINAPNYPLEKKLKEIQNITQKDDLHDAVKAIPLVVDKLIQQFSNTKYKDCYNYIEYLFTPLFFSILDKIGENPEHPRSINEIYLQKAACYWIEYPETKQENISVKVCDFFMPLYREFNFQVTNKQTGEYTEELCLEYYKRKPDPEEFYNYWNVYWVNRTKSIGEKDLIGIEIYKESINKDFIISLMYEGKKLSFKSGEYFNVQLLKRYSPLIEKIIEKAFDKYGWIYKDDPIKGAKKDDPIKGVKWEFENQLINKLWDLAHSYEDKLEYPRPEGYFKEKLKHFGRDKLYKSSEVSTTAANVPCDKDCRKQKFYENELLKNGSCKLEDSRGFCKDPKRGRVIRTKFESSGGSLDTFINDDDGDDIHRHELFEGSTIDLVISRDSLLKRLNQEEKDLFCAYYLTDLTQIELAKKYGLSQSSISEKLSKLENKIFDLL